MTGEKRNRGEKKGGKEDQSQRTTNNCKRDKYERRCSRLEGLITKQYPYRKDQDAAINAPALEHVNHYEIQPRAEKKKKIIATPRPQGNNKHNISVILAQVQSFDKVNNAPTPLSNLLN